MSYQANGKIRAGGTPALLVDRARTGDREAFAVLYTEYRDGVLAYLYSRTHDRHLAEDLAQEVFVRALRRINTFDSQRDGGGVAAWLMVIARNLHLDHVKLARVQREVPVAELLDGDERDRSAEVSALRQFDIAEASGIVADAMATLTPYQRACVRMRFLEELSIPETAARLGKGIGATKTCQFRALRVMQNALTGAVAAA
ncbi:RNA polymerase sigma factor [Streptomyces murinus]|uniref:RNA polymerase sigma factor n=1 Tax=Streptomyces murinus TaxID=33900 RepID=UPI002E0D580D|nr:RNA polymerase sigma factor [Streptomyces murinus]